MQAVREASAWRHHQRRRRRLLMTSGSCFIFIYISKLSFKWRDEFSLWLSRGRNCRVSISERAEGRMLNVNFHVVSYSRLTVLITSLKTTQRGSESEVSSDIYDAFRRRKLSALISSPRRPWNIFALQSSTHKGFFRCEKAFSAPTSGSTRGKAACDWRQARVDCHWFKQVFFTSSDNSLQTLWKLKFNRNWINYWSGFILLSYFKLFI